MKFITNPSNTEPVKLQVFQLNPAAAAPTNRFFILTNNNPGSLPFRPPKAPLPGCGHLINQPAPGVYEGVPYRCIVVVPGAQLDDGCVVGPSVVQPPMPTITPDLELIPQKPK